MHEVRARRLVGVGEVDDDPVVGPDRVGLEAELVADARAAAPAPRRRGRGRRTGERTHSRQSPISSRKRSTTIVRSRRHDARGLLLLAQEVEQVARRERVEVVVALERLGVWSTAQRANAPIASPSSFGRPTPSPFQNGTAPGTPGAGVTITRSRPISSIRHVDAPSRNVWPGARLVDHLLVELADAAPVGQDDANRPRSGIVPALVTASWRAPLRARIVPATRSQTIRGRSSANSCDG